MQAWAHFDGLVALGEMTEEQFKYVSLKIDRSGRKDSEETFRADNVRHRFRDSWPEMFRQ